VVVGAASQSTEPAFPGTRAALVAVAESATGRGVGSALADLPDDQLALANETLPVTCTLRDDLVDGRRFAEQRGSTEGPPCGHARRSRRPGRGLETFARDTALSAGVGVRQADVDEDIQTILECSVRCLPGLPSDQQQVDPMRAQRLIPDEAVVLLAESLADNPVCRSPLA
jgi:hypothetical protein